MSRREPGPHARDTLAGGTRSNVVDIAKGTAIILVVFGHTAQGLMHRGWWFGHAAASSEAFIYSFHMPAFFFIAGLFVMGSIRKRGARSFIAEKLKTILWPYLIVSFISFVTVPLANHFRSAYTVLHWKPLLLDFVDGEWNWFLFTLFFCLLLALLTSRMPAGLRFLLAVFVALTPHYGPPLSNQVLHEFCFMTAGMWVESQIFALERIPPSTTALGFIALSLLQSWGIHLQTYQWTHVALGLTGTAGLFLLATLLDNHQVGEALAWIGRASLAIFILSSLPQGATRELLSHVFHTHNVWLHLTFTTALATLLPVIVWYQQDRWRLRWLFRWP